MKFNRVLLIDDSEIDNYLTKAILTKSKIAGHITAMRSAVDALEYLVLLKENPAEFPDAIFVDIRMPEMDGFEFLNAYMKLHDVNTRAMVFMLSSSKDQSDVDRAFQYPMVKKYLIKPLIITDLDSL